MANEGFRVLKVVFDLREQYTVVTVTLETHDTKVISTKQKNFAPEISASEIIRMHMDYINEWNDGTADPGTIAK